MRFNSVVAMVLACTGFFSGAAMAQQGELIISPSYIKPGCTGWEFKEGGSIGSPPGSNAPSSYQLFAVSCNGGYVAKKTVLIYTNGNSNTCTVSLINTAGYTLTGTNCSTFEVRSAVVVPLGELIISPSYIKPGCTGWVFKEGGSIGSPPGSSAPSSYQTFAVSCNGAYVAQKSVLIYTNGSANTCSVILLNTTSYTLTGGSSCSAFEVRAK